MLKIGVLSVLLAFLASNAFAKCDSGTKTVFSCSTSKGKQIEVCDSGKTISYSFGKPNLKPEIVVTVPRAQASTSQWNGIGRYISYSVEIPNGNTVYNVFDSADRNEQISESGVNVIIKGKHAATVKCSGKGVVSNLEGIDLKPSE